MSVGILFLLINVAYGGGETLLVMSLCIFLSYYVDLTIKHVFRE